MALSPRETQKIAEAVRADRLADLAWVSDLVKFIAFVRRWIWIHGAVAVIAVCLYNYLVGDEQKRVKKDLIDARKELQANVADTKKELGEKLDLDNRVTQGKIDVVSKQVDEIRHLFDQFLLNLPHKQDADAPQPTVIIARDRRTDDE